MLLRGSVSTRRGEVELTCRRAGDMWEATCAGHAAIGVTPRESAIKCVRHGYDTGALLTVNGKVIVDIAHLGVFSVICDYHENRSCVSKEKSSCALPPSVVV